MKYIALLLALLALPAAAQPTPTITARLISPQTAVGDTATIPLALQLTLPSGWHTYWRTPGIAGLPPSLTWETKDNVTNVDIQYPTPMRSRMMGLDSFGYHDAVTFPLVATLAQPGKPIALKGRVDIVMCDEICAPANAVIEVNVPAGASTASADASVWQAAIDALPLKPSTATVTGITRTNDTLTISLQHDAASQFTDVITENADAIVLRAATVTPIEGGTQFTTQFDSASEAPMLDGKPVTLTFLGTPNAIELTGTVGATAIVPTAIPTPVAPAQEAVPENTHIIGILLIALLGGLILNLMPCVLPVLSLKLLTIVSHAGHDSAAQVRRGFITSSLGILASFWLLAAGTIALKQTGMALGWGLQFQHPGFLLGIVIVLLVFAANLFGLFEFRLPHALQNKLGKPSDGTGTIKEFLTGMAAAILATPCSAPFVGTAISFALAQSSAIILSIFTALGLGLASPYLLVALFPRIAQHLPRPGAWMRHLRTFMGILLLGSAVWFGNILLSQISTTSETTTEQELFNWQPFAPETIPARVAQGKTVFLDITAKWCLTCHANKGFVLNNQPTYSALQAENIVLMQGDWTRPSDTIQAYLKTYNRYGIPFNIVFGPNAPQGIVLPELLTHDAIAEALAKAR